MIPAAGGLGKCVVMETLLKARDALDMAEYRLPPAPPLQGTTAVDKRAPVLYAYDGLKGEQLLTMRRMIKCNVMRPAPAGNGLYVLNPLYYSKIERQDGGQAVAGAEIARFLKVLRVGTVWTTLRRAARLASGASATHSRKRSRSRSSSSSSEDAVAADEVLSVVETPAQPAWVTQDGRLAALEAQVRALTEVVERQSKMPRVVTEQERLLDAARTFRENPADATKQAEAESRIAERLLNKITWRTALGTVVRTPAVKEMMVVVEVSEGRLCLELDEEAAHLNRVISTTAALLNNLGVRALRVPRPGVFAMQVVLTVQ